MALQSGLAFHSMAPGGFLGLLIGLMLISHLGVLA